MYSASGIHYIALQSLAHAFVTCNTYSVSKLEASLGIITVVVSFQKFLCLIEQISTMLTATSKVTMCAMILFVIFSFKPIARDTSGMF